MIQFIKGTWPNGERNLLEPHGVEFQVMATGFTWNTQDRDSDTAACLAVWEHARRMLADDQLDLVLLDELTYMVAYDYLPLESVLSALRERPAHQSVIITAAAVIAILLNWPIPSANCVRSSMHLMPGLKRRWGLTTKGLIARRKYAFRRQVTGTHNINR